MTDEIQQPGPDPAPTATELLGLASQVVRGLRESMAAHDGSLQQASLAEVTESLGGLCIELVRLKGAPTVGPTADTAELEELRGQLQAAHRELGRLEERHRVEVELREQLRHARADTARLRAEERGHLSRTLELERARAQLDEARSEVDAHRDEVTQLRKRLEETAVSSGSRDEAVNQLNALRLAHEEQGARLRCAEFLNAELRQELVSVREERDRLLQRDADDPSGLPLPAELLAERTRLEAACEQLRADLRVLEESRRFQSRRLTRYQERIQDQEQTIHTLAAENTELRSEHPNKRLDQTDVLSRLQMRAVLDNPIHRPALRNEPESDPTTPDAPLREPLPSLAREDDPAS